MLNGKRGELSFGTVMMVRFTLFAKIELLTPTLLLNISWKVVSSNFSISLPGEDTSHKQSLDTYLLNCEPKLYIFFMAKAYKNSADSYAQVTENRVLH